MMFEQNHAIKRKTAAKIAKISVVILLISFALLATCFFEVSSIFKNDFLMFVYLFAAVIFGFSLTFSTIMLFLSKQHNDKIYFSIICYVLIASIVVVAIIAIINAIKQFAYLASLPNMKIDEELILRVINGINPYLIAIGIMSVLFELSMIVSFELKYLKGDALMITTLIAYIVVVIASPFLALIKNNFVACISLVLDVLSFSALFYLLEDKTTEVVCLQYVNENGEKIQEVDAASVLGRKRIKKSINVGAVIRIAVEIFVAILFFMYANSLFKSSIVTVPLIMEIILIVGVFFSFFYFNNGKKLKAIDLISCASMVVGATLMLLCFTIVELSGALLVALGIISALTLILGGTRFFFLKKMDNKGLTVLKWIIYVLFVLVGVYYLLLSIFSLGTRANFKLATPILYPVIQILLLAMYLVYRIDD